MTNLLSRALCVLPLIAVTATGAHAQGAPVNQAWSLQLGITGSYEDNALFTGFDENTEFAHHLQASLGRSWMLRRGSFSLTGRASKPFYRESTGLNDLQYSLAGSLSYAMTRRLSWVGSTNFSSSLARDSEVLIDAGLVLPSVTARSTSSTSMFSYLLTKRSQMSWTLAQTGVDFQSAFFFGGSQVVSTVNWSHQVGRAQALGVSQEYQRTFSEGIDGTIYGVFGTWSMVGGRGWTASASAGVRPYTVPSESGYRITAALNASIAKMVRLGQTLTVTYSDTIEQTFGLDGTNHIVHSVSGMYLLGLGRAVSASFGGSYSRGRNPVTDALLVGGSGQASITYRIRDNVGLMVGHSLFSRTDPERPRVVSNTTFVSLTYDTKW